MHALQPYNPKRGSAAGRVRPCRFLHSLSTLCPGVPIKHSLVVDGLVPYVLLVGRVVRLARVRAQVVFDTCRAQVLHCLGTDGAISKAIGLCQATPLIS